MAVDTRAKRSSAISISSPWRSMLPAPDSAIGQGDRQAVPYMYSGILAGAVVASTSGTRHMRQSKSTHRKRRRC